jgi:cytochrome c oxidase cbb3-type subunit 3
MTNEEVRVVATVEKDPLTGTETTGHEWDGIKELDTPLPRWWVFTLWVTVVWGIGYVIVYPAWPSLSDYTRGLFGYSSRAELAEELAQVKASRAGWLKRFEAASVEDVAKDNELLNYAMAGGRVIFADNCAPCHGSGGAGAKGYPVLADDDWLWGGTLDQVHETIRVGVRGTHDDTRDSSMPRFGVEETLDKAEIAAVADYVMALAGGGAGDAAAKEVYVEQCAGCHGEDGKGMHEGGGPNLTDGIWLYGEGRDAVMAQIGNPKHGVMPTWEGRLDAVSIKQVAVYVHSLGGGQ